MQLVPRRLVEPCIPGRHGGRPTTSVGVRTAASAGTPNELTPRGRRPFSAPAGEDRQTSSPASTSQPYNSRDDARSSGNDSGYSQRRSDRDGDGYGRRENGHAGGGDSRREGGSNSNRDGGGNSTSRNRVGRQFPSPARSPKGKPAGRRHPSKAAPLSFPPPPAAPAAVRNLSRFQAVVQLLRIEQEGAFASLAAGTPSPSPVLQDTRSELTPRDQRQVTELVSNVTRWRRRLDYTISELACKSAQDLDPAMRQILRVAIYELTREEHALPPHVVSEHVEIAKAMVHEGAASFANGVLRAATRRLELGTLPLPPVDTTEGPTRKLARQLGIAHSHPTWMVVRWMRRFGATGAVQLMEHYNLGKPTYTIRLNSFWSGGGGGSGVLEDEDGLGAGTEDVAAAEEEREEEAASTHQRSEQADTTSPAPATAATDAASTSGAAPTSTVGAGGDEGGGADNSVSALLADLEAAGVSASPSPYLPDAFVRVREGLQTLLTQGYVSSGRCSVQDESAGLVVALLDPQPGDRVLDACAAPGGKTLGAAMRMRGQGSLTAMDVSATRLAALERAVRAAGGLDDLVTTVVSGLVEYAEEQAPAGRQFDRVLVDAPCSGTGVLGKRVDMRWRRTAEELVELMELQDSLLHAASRLVAPGGVLVYSTCSIEAEEDEDRVSAFLHSHPGWAVEAPLARAADGSVRRLRVVPHAAQEAAEEEGAHRSAQTSDSVMDPEAVLRSGLPVLPAEVLTREGFLATLPHVHATDGAFAARLRAPTVAAAAAAAARIAGL